MNALLAKQGGFFWVGWGSACGRFLFVLVLRRRPRPRGFEVNQGSGRGAPSKIGLWGVQPRWQEGVFEDEDDDEGRGRLVWAL